MPSRLTLVNCRTAGNNKRLQSSAETAARVSTGISWKPRRTRVIDEDVYHWFYRVERRSVVGLSDGGGPFGFDIITALQVDYLIDRHGCEAIVETGCHMGDTTKYLALRYPDIPLISCDIDGQLAAFTRDRLGEHANVSVRHADSPNVVEEANGQYERPFYYLDAHGGEDWPLSKEIGAIDKGIVCIDDFDIGHERRAVQRSRFEVSPICHRLEA